VAVIYTFYVYYGHMPVINPVKIWKNKNFSGLAKFRVNPENSQKMGKVCAIGGISAKITQTDRFWRSLFSERPEMRSKRFRFLLSQE